MIISDPVGFKTFKIEVGSYIKSTPIERK